MTFFTDDNSRINTAGETWSYSATPSGELRFEARADDYYANPNAGPGESDFEQGKNRSSITSFLSMQPGREFEVAFDVEVEAGAPNTADWVVLAQLHQTEDRDANGNLLDIPASPPVVLGMLGEKLVILNRTDPNAALTSDPATQRLWEDPNDVMRGHVYSVRMEVVFDHTGTNSLLNVWIDNVQVVSHTGATGYNDQVGPYLSVGVYREQADETLAAVFSNIDVNGEGTPPPMDGTAGNDEIIAAKLGFWESEVLNGFGGNDTLNGGVGADTMNGGTGNDIYVVENIGDVANESANQGTDQVQSFVDYTLSANIENMILQGTGDIDGTGNGLVNRLQGTIGDNVLRGLGGDDEVLGDNGNDLLEGGDGNDRVFGGSGNDTVEGGAGNDALFGEAGNDSLVGGAGNDTLEGGAGRDTAHGGAGNDEYVITDAGDAALESVGNGNDTVRASVSFSAGTSEIEDIRTTDQSSLSAINLTGSSHTNQLRGNEGDNRLDGGVGGNDTLFGYGGDDTLSAGAGNDSLVGGAGDDSLSAGAGNDILRGDAGRDTLRGGEGNDSLYSGTGDRGVLDGGAGDDTYYVDAEHTTVSEAAGGGTDTIRTTVSIALDAASQIEVLRVADQNTINALDLQGSGIANEMRGNAGDNVLNGGAGADTMVGYGGDDVYFVDNAGDRVTESAGNGEDEVRTTISYSLSDSQSIEALVAADFASTSALALSGNAGDNAIAGNAGANTLNGRGGNDLLYSGSGNDVIRGGDGNDTALFSIASTQVGVSVGGTSIVLTLKDGTKNVRNDVENFKFSDITLTYAQVAALQGQTLGRTDMTASTDGDLMIGSTGNDVMLGNSGEDYIIAGTGNDTIQAGAGDDDIVGGGGNDVIRGGAGTDSYQFSVAVADVTVFDTATGLAVSSTEGVDLFTNDMENFEFSDAYLSYAELAALVGSGGVGTVGPDVTGTNNAENVNGTAASEIINAGAGGDWITPGAGSDTVDGGDGRDMVSFVNLVDTPGRAVTEYRLTLDLEAGRVTTSGGDTYTLSNVERVTATVNEDFLRGDAGDNELRGLGAYDWFVATTGSDIYDGGQGKDMVSFLEWNSDRINVADAFDTGAPLIGGAVSGVMVNLANASANTNLAAGHEFRSIERITGSSREDVFFGDNGENDFRGLGGYDWFVGSSGGRERYFGGDGIDTMTYYLSDAGITASLSNGSRVNGEETGRGTGGDAARDLYFEMENLVGTNHADNITGSNGKNQLSGLNGDDFIYGLGGGDALKGGAGSDVLNGGGGTDTAYFDGDLADYTLNRINATTVLVTAANADQDRAINIEMFQFDDQMVELSDLPL